MENRDYANLLIELESRMIEMETREKEWMFQSRDLKKDFKSSLATLTKSIHRAEDAIKKQLEKNEILAVANVRKSECDIYFQAMFKLERLWKKRLPICGEPLNFQRKMQQYLTFVIRHALSDEILIIWIEVFFFTLSELKKLKLIAFLSQLLATMCQQGSSRIVIKS